MKLFKLFLFALALSFVAPQAIDARPRKKHRTTRVKSRKRGHKHHYVVQGWGSNETAYECTICHHWYYKKY